MKITRQNAGVGIFLIILGLAIGIAYGVILLTIVQNKFASTGTYPSASLVFLVAPIVGIIVSHLLFYGFQLSSQKGGLAQGQEIDMPYKNVLTFPSYWATVILITAAAIVLTWWWRSEL